MIVINRKDLIYHISNCAYIEAHRLDSSETSAIDKCQPHIIADICTEGNIDRVNAIIALCITLLASALGAPAPPGDVVTDDITIDIGQHRHHDNCTKLRLAATEYITATVMSHWLGMLGMDRSYWQTTADAALAAVRATSQSVWNRRLPPI